jgi:hypothetical protein
MLVRTRNDSSSLKFTKPNTPTICVLGQKTTRAKMMQLSRFLLLSFLAVKAASSTVRSNLPLNKYHEDIFSNPDPFLKMFDFRFYKQHTASNAEQIHLCVEMVLHRITSAQMLVRITMVPIFQNH